MPANCLDNARAAQHEIGPLAIVVFPGHTVFGWSRVTKAAWDVDCDNHRQDIAYAWDDTNATRSFDTAMTQTPRIEFWFEFASTYSYPAAMRIESLALEHGASVDWRAFLLGPIFRDVGWDDSPFNIYPAKGRYMWRDMERVCKAHGIPFNRPSTFPRNGLLASRIACRNSDEPWLPHFVKSVYAANFARDLDIASTETLEDCLAGCVADPGRVIEDTQSSHSKNALRQQTEEARDRGVFGAPTFFRGGEMYWGNDRLEMALQSEA